MCVIHVCTLLHLSVSNDLRSTLPSLERGNWCICSNAQTTWMWPNKSFFAGILCKGQGLSFEIVMRNSVQGGNLYTNGLSVLHNACSTVCLISPRWKQLLVLCYPHARVQFSILWSFLKLHYTYEFSIYTLALLFSLCCYMSRIKTSCKLCFL